jgi:hypothetical protein
MNECAEAAARLCEFIGPHWAEILGEVFDFAKYAVAAYVVWRARRTVRRIEGKVETVEGKVETVHKVLSTPPPPMPIDSPRISAPPGVSLEAVAEIVSAVKEREKP